MKPLLFSKRLFCGLGTNSSGTELPGLQGVQGCGSFRLCRGCWEPLSPRYVLLSGLGRHCSVEMGPPSTPGTTGRCLPSVSLVLLWFPMSSSRVLGLSELIFLDQGRSSGFKKNGSLGIKQIPLPAQ